MKKIITALTLANLISGCAETIPSEQLSQENNIPRRERSESNREDPYISPVTTDIHFDEPDYISGIMVPREQQDTEESADTPRNESINQCEVPKSYDVEADFQLPLGSSYGINQDVPWRAVMTNYGDRFKPMMLISVISEEDEANTVLGFASRINSGEHASFNITDMFSDPGTYHYEMLVFDCDCIEEIFDTESCVGRSMNIFDQSDYFETLRARTSLAYDLESIEVTE